MYQVYILQSVKDGKYYIGSTSNLAKRLERHNKGGNVSTRWCRPLVLVYSETYTRKSDALMREREIKSYKGGEVFRDLIKNNTRRW